MNPVRVHAAMVRFVHLVNQAGAAELREFGLTPAQYQLLVFIGRTPGVAQWQVGAAFGVTKGNVSQLVSRLEAAGLIERTRSDGTDQLAVSAAGRDLVDRVVPAHNAFMARQYEPLTHDELAILQGLLVRLSHR